MNPTLNQSIRHALRYTQSLYKLRMRVRFSNRGGCVAILKNNGSRKGQCPSTRSPFAVCEGGRGEGGTLQLTESPGNKQNSGCYHMPTSASVITGSILTARSLHQFSDISHSYPAPLTDVGERVTPTSTLPPPPLFPHCSHFNCLCCLSAICYSTRHGPDPFPSPLPT